MKLEERNFGKWLVQALFVLMLLVRAGVLAAVAVSFLPKFAGDMRVQMILIASMVDLGAVLLLWIFNKGAKWLSKRGSRSLILSPLLLLVVYVLSIVVVGLDPASAAAKAVEAACFVFLGIYLVLSYVFLVLDLVDKFKKKSEPPKRGIR